MIITKRVDLLSYDNLIKLKAGSIGNMLSIDYQW